MIILIYKYNSGVLGAVNHAEKIFSALSTQFSVYALVGADNYIKKQTPF